ncbi:YbaB/EbfC family nucleoid-associated protein [Desulfovibrio psychrotolerans]|uniref:Nucleoid-associated protein DSM19430T_32540 n=1 Tax=Desulfovibrio psychrotolerans TaxID=415242 RepID=A0A7J0BY02_9BACT|nr:YbaB/EbfC family nucleoid-associated protein [Desulfovibrio psychrotolerans]GFM38570.1 nucleoid-associated protein [Desulfovibrio psychrotolerans]
MRGMNDMLRQAQQMQRKMTELQDQLGTRTVEATSGGGMVAVVCNGKQDILSIKIDPAAVDPSDVDMLQDLVLTAINEAIRQSKAMVEKEMGAITGGMKIPGLF